MKVLFWNIGTTSLDSVGKPEYFKKFEIIEDVVQSLQPDVICIAEGTGSMKLCNHLNALFNNANFTTYYSPLKARSSKDYDYGYVKPGLKIYYRHNLKGVEQCDVTHQKRDGRMVLFKTNNGRMKRGVLFVHGRSFKSSGRERAEYFMALSDWIKVSKVYQGNDKFVILGDINQYPWHEDLSSKGYSETYYTKNGYRIGELTQKLNPTIGRPARVPFYNPIIDCLLSLPEKSNVQGTRCDQTIGWSTIDFPQILGCDAGKCRIIEESAKFELVKQGTLVKNDFINYKFDHLPITLDI